MEKTRRLEILSLSSLLRNVKFNVRLSTIVVSCGAISKGLSANRKHKNSHIMNRCK